MYKLIEELDDFELEYFGQMAVYGEFHRINAYLWECYSQLFYFVKKFKLNIETVPESNNIKQRYIVYCDTFGIHGYELEKTIIKAIIGYKFGSGCVNVDEIK